MRGNRLFRGNGINSWGSRRRNGDRPWPARPDGLRSAPLVDDAAFDLGLQTESVDEAKRRRDHRLIDIGANVLNAVLTLCAEGNLAAGLLNQAALVPAASLPGPLRERFDAVDRHLQRVLGELPPKLDTGDLRRVSAELLELGKGDRSADAIVGGKLVMIILAAASVFGAAIVMFTYVGPRIIHPLESITDAMTDLAAGDTSVDTPGRDRGDELGRMAQALGVFRDTAIEVQESNLREIREARRRLTDAIESISEAFSLYDPEDRLIICNSKYRSLLYAPRGAKEDALACVEMAIAMRERMRDLETVVDRVTDPGAPGGNKATKA